MLSLLILLLQLLPPQLLFLHPLMPLSDSPVELSLLLIPLAGIEDLFEQFNLFI